MPRNETSVPILPVLADRWSPRGFDDQHVITREQLTPAFEAARWSASANNKQPWSFIVGLRGDKTFETIAKHLLNFNAAWAPAASALVVNVVHPVDADGKENPFAYYDLGQAAAHFSVQAHADGFVVHQIAGVEKDALAADLGITDTERIFTVTVVGVPATDRSRVPEAINERDAMPRHRKPLDEVVSFPG